MAGNKQETTFGAVKDGGRNRSNNEYISLYFWKLIAIMTVVQEYIARDHDYHFEYSYQLNCGGKNPRIDEYWTGPTYYELGYEQSIRDLDDYTAYINQVLREYNTHVEHVKDSSKLPDNHREELAESYGYTNIYQLRQKRINEINSLIYEVLSQYRYSKGG